MKKSLPFWQIAGFIFTGIFGVILHFLYEWSGGSPVAALFSGVNESTWEHMKLLFFPQLFFALFQGYRMGNRYPNFWCVKLLGIAAGLLAIPLWYYTYTGVLGVNADWFNITIFFLAAALSYRWETYLFRQKSCPLSPALSVLLLGFLTLLFFLFTFYPPKIPLFWEPK